MSIVAHDAVQHHNHTSVLATPTQRCKRILGRQRPAILDKPFQRQSQHLTNFLRQHRNGDATNRTGTHKRQPLQSCFQRILTHPILDGLHVGDGVNQIAGRFHDGGIGDRTMRKHRRRILNRFIEKEVTEWNAQLTAELGELIDRRISLACAPTFNVALVIRRQAL